MRWGVPPVDVDTEPGELDRVEERSVSGVTLCVPPLGVVARGGLARTRSGDGRSGDISGDDTDSEPEMMKLLISINAGASIPGSFDVNAFTAGYTIVPMLLCRDC